MPDKSTEEFLSLARERFDFGRAADDYDRKQAEDDNCFANSDNSDLGQWDAAAKRARKNRPILQWNRVPTYIQQVVNDGRQNKPSIRISVSDGGQQETAEYIQARIRHVEYEANADTAKDTARDQQVTSGRGFIRVRTEYVPGTFQQRIRLDRIENQFSVVWDPASQEYDRSDASWCFVISHISKDAFEDQYGTKIDKTEFAALSREFPQWFGVGHEGKMIQIADYYVRECSKETLCEVQGMPVWKKDLPSYDKLKAKGLITGEREDECPCVWHYVINGAEVLKKTQWIGSTIPIVPFWGREATVDGKRRTFSLSRNAQGPQKLLNLFVSNLAEIIGQQPKTPYLVPVGGIPAQVEGQWAGVNREAFAYLLYNQFDEQGRPLQPPTRVLQEPPVQALVIGIQQCIDAIKASMGIYDASLGARSNEQSGKAIERRRQQSDITNYHFPDNEARSNKYLGQILVELIKEIDTPGNSYPIRTEDGKTHVVPVGEEHRDWKTGKVVCHDLRAGSYEVTVSTGPSYESSQQEAEQIDNERIAANPELMFVYGDLMEAASGRPGSQERAERLKRFIAIKAPGLIQDKNQEPIPPQIQAQMAQLAQERDQAHAFAQSLHEKLETKQPELDNAVRLKQMDLDFQREKLATDSTLKLSIEEMKAGILADITHLKAQIQAIQHERGLQAQDSAQRAEHEQQERMADKQQAAALEQQEQAHAGVLEQQEQAAKLAPKPKPQK